MYLVDTDVLLAGAPGRPERPASFAEWMDAHSDELFVSAVSVAEISEAIVRLERTGSPSRAAGLRDWLDLVLHLYGERVLPFDASAACLAGRLMDEAREASPTYGVAELAVPAVSGSRRVTIMVPNAHHHHPQPGIADIAVAAIAESHDLTILTRSPSRFMALGVPAMDPFETLPGA